MLKLLSLMCFIYALDFRHQAQATIVGSPPITEISIPSEPYVTFFDMAQDHNNVIYLSYEKGVKIYDGTRWQTLLIPNTYLTRILYFDQKDRVYVGGFDFFGYIIRNQFGSYEFVSLTPPDYPIEFASIWGITACNGLIFFQALNHVFSYEPDSGDINSWPFVGKLGDLECIDNQVWLQDRSEGLKVLANNQWLNSDIKLDDNSLIYEFETLQNNTIFIRSLSNNWRLIEGDQVKSIEFSSQLPELGSFASSLTLNDNHMVLGGKDGTLTFLDFNQFTSESFQLSSDWVSAIVKSKDGGLLILSNFKIYHLTWPSPWRIQDSDTGLSSDIFDLTTWNNQLYATSRSGVFVEDVNQATQQHKSFKPLNLTTQEAWNLLPINPDEMLLADSHYAYLIKNNEKQILTEIIYPRTFVQSKYNPNHIYMLTELDTRLLVRNGDNWHDWVVAEGKPSSFVEVENDTLLITNEDGRFLKVLMNDELNSIEATIEMNGQTNLAPEEINQLTLFEGPNNQVLAATDSHFYQYLNDELIATDLYGLTDIQPPSDLSMMGTKNGTLWALSATHAYLLDAKNQWLVIDASPYINGGIYDIEFYADQVKLSANGMILSYLFNQPNTANVVSGQMLITAAKLNNTASSQIIEIPLSSTTPYVFGPEAGGLTVQYSFTDIKNSAATQYQYRIKGHNNQWSPYSKNTQASLLELPAGSYSFEVRALDVNGQTHNSQSLTFVVEPAWYLTTLAKILWFALFLLLGLIGMKLFLNWRERKHEEQKQALKEIINEKTNALKLANQALQDLAHKDSLTGLSNRLYLDKYINQLIINRVDTFSVLMMDMDHFKKYNDTYGHLAGDQLLEKFSQSLMTRINRKQDLAARYGGEEFLVIMPKASAEYTLRTAENIRSHTEQQAEKTTISMGVAFATAEHKIRSAKDVFKLIDQADKALYEAKTTGRNQIVTYSETLEHSS